MIMPCMNSTSAFERGGSAAFVEGGSVLLGLPGAPGCTTAGLTESFCCASTAGDKTNLRIPREHSRTGVPAQNGVVVSMRPEGFGSLVVIHRLAQGMIGIGIAGGPVLTEVRMGLAFPDETGVVGTLVLTFDAGEQLFRRFHRSAVVKLIGARKQERNERLLMGRQNRQDVQANAFGQVRFVQKPVTFGLLQSLGNGIGRDGF